MSQLQNPEVLRLAESGCGLSARYKGVKLQRIQLRKCSKRNAAAGFGVTSGKSRIYSGKAEDSGRSGASVFWGFAITSIDRAG
jgi:hypothetical protein